MILHRSRIFQKLPGGFKGFQQVSEVLGVSGCIRIILWGFRRFYGPSGCAPVVFQGI